MHCVFLDFQGAVLSDVLLTSSPLATTFGAVQKRVMAGPVDHHLQRVLALAQREDLMDLMNPGLNALPGLLVERF